MDEEKKTTRTEQFQKYLDGLTLLAGHTIELMDKAHADDELEWPNRYSYSDFEDDMMELYNEIHSVHQEMYGQLLEAIDEDPEEAKRQAVETSIKWLTRLGYKIEPPSQEPTVNAKAQS